MVSWQDGPGPVRPRLSSAPVYIEETLVRGGVSFLGVLRRVCRTNPADHVQLPRAENDHLVADDPLPEVDHCVVLLGALLVIMGSIAGGHASISARILASLSVSLGLEKPIQPVIRLWSEPVKPYFSVFFVKFRLKIVTFYKVTVFIRFNFSL